MPEWMLCLDASAPRTCVALGHFSSERGSASEAQLVIEDAREDRANQTSAVLDQRLRAALDQAGIGPAQLRYVACGRGPGTFTGSRVAVATAKGLALGLGISVVPVSTLAALAASAELPGAPASILALLDARRQQVYAGTFELGELGLRATSSEQVTELESFVAGLEPSALSELVPVGPGCGPYAEQLPEDLRARSRLSPGPTPAGLWRAALASLRAGAACDPGAFSVTYLRESYAQMGINKPKRPMYKSPFV